jgi:hypothetical protein
MEALQDILVEAGVMEDSEVEDMDYEEEWTYKSILPDTMPDIG